MFLLMCAILFRGEQQQITNPLGVAPLVIVPGDELDKVFVEGDTSGGVKDRGVVVTDEISGYDRVFSVVEDALVGTCGGFFYRGFDLFIRSLLLGTHDKVDDGDIDGGYTERETTIV